MCAIRIDPEEMKRVAVHESGHAIIAVKLGIVCHGVFFAYEPRHVAASGEITGGRFCTPVGTKPPWNKNDYLQSAAGAGAEKLLFKGYNRDASADDRDMFSISGAPEWDTTVDEAKMILEKSSDIVGEMAGKIVSKHQNIPMRLWPDRGMDGRSTRFKQILSGEEVLQMAGTGGIEPSPQKDTTSDENEKKV